MKQNIKNEEILKNNCNKIASAIEAMITAGKYEHHHSASVKKEAKKISKEARDSIRDILVELIKSASDPNFVLKDVEIKNNDEFKFLQIKD